MQLKTNQILNLYILTILTIVFFAITSTAQIDANKELIKIDKLSAKNLDSALKYTDSILNLDFKNKDTIQFEYCKLTFRSYKFDKALQLYKELEKKAKSNNQYDYLLATYLKIAQINAILTNQDIAIEYAHKALNLSKKLKNIDDQSEALNIFAYIYSTVEDYNKAIYYLNEFIKLQKDKQKLVASGYQNLSICYLKLNKLDSAKNYLKKALPIFTKLKEQERLSLLYDNMGEIDNKSKNYVDAIKNYKKAIDIEKKFNTNFLDPYLNLAKIYHHLSKYNKANEYYLKALHIAKKTKNLEKQEDIYKKLLSLALNLQDTKKAQYYLTKRDSLYQININKTNIDKLQLINTQFEQREKEEKYKQELALNKKNNIILYTVIGLLLFIGLFSYQKIKNSKLSLNHEKLVLEQKVLRAQMNPHFIFNALTSIQKKLFEDDIIKSSNALTRFAKLIRQNFEFTNKSLITLEEELESLKNYIETQQLRFEDEFEYQINVQNKLDISYIKIPPMLIQPFVENAIEHGINPMKEKGNLIINIISKNGTHYTFEIIDDGIGYTAKDSNQEHAIDIFLKRLKLRNLKEEHSFKVSQGLNGKGTKISFTLNL